MEAKRQHQASPREGGETPREMAHPEAEKERAEGSEWREKMDVREYIGGTFLKPEDIGATPVVLTIVGVAMGKFDKLDLTFADGSKRG